MAIAITGRKLFMGLAENIKERKNVIVEIFMEEFIAGITVKISQLLMLLIRSFKDNIFGVLIASLTLI